MTLQPIEIECGNGKAVNSCRLTGIRPITITTTITCTSTVESEAYPVFSGPYPTATRFQLQSSLTKKSITQIYRSFHRHTHSATHHHYYYSSTANGHFLKPDFLLPCLFPNNNYYYHYYYYY